MSLIQSNMRTSAQYPRGHAMLPAWPLIVIGSCELPTTTAVGAHAQDQYSKRFRTAIGHHRPQARALGPSSKAKSAASGTVEPYRGGFLVTVTCLVDSYTSHDRANLVLSTACPPKRMRGSRSDDPPSSPVFVRHKLRK